jgi:hypothetical protein
VVNFTFEDASSSAASESDIQSEGGFDIGQSGSFAAATVPVADSAPDAAPVPPPDDSAPDVEPDAVPDVASVSLAEVPPTSPEPTAASFDAARPDLPELDRSLRAQPLPLKWTAGAENARFISPPHFGQVDGPWPWTECITSIVWPQFEQT